MARRQPLDAEPARNFKCRHYSDCLAIIALASGKDSNPCRGCPFEHDQGGQPGDFHRDLTGSLALLLCLIADEKTIKNHSVQTLLDSIFERLTQYVGVIAGQRFEMRPFVEAELRRRGAQ